MYVQFSSCVHWNWSRRKSLIGHGKGRNGEFLKVYVTHFAYEHYFHNLSNSNGSDCLDEMNKTPSRNMAWQTILRETALFISSKQSDPFELDKL